MSHLISHALSPRRRLRPPYPPPPSLWRPANGNFWRLHQNVFDTVALCERSDDSRTNFDVTGEMGVKRKRQLAGDYLHYLQPARDMYLAGRKVKSALSRPEVS